MKLSTFRKGLRNPSEIPPYLSTKLFQAVGSVHWDVLGKGVNVMEEDWDNLIILDACRFDYFRDKVGEFDVEGDLSKQISRGSQTIQFLTENFGGQTFPDTVMVSGNANITKVDAVFHDLVEQYKDHREPLFPELYDDPPTTMLPETTTELARSTSAEYPDKRLIVHYIPPHSPYLGPTGKRFYDRDVKWTEQINRGTLSIETVVQAYEENVEIALSSVEDLLPDLTGKTVITSDHGELFGEWGVIEHPGNVYISQLVQVPWFEVDFSERKSITSESADTESSELTEDIEEQLEVLGYK